MGRVAAPNGAAALARPTSRFYQATYSEPKSSNVFISSPLQDNYHMTTDDHNASRRDLLQTGAAALATGLAGCAGGNGSDGSDDTDEEDSSDVDSTPEETTEPEPDYSLPESEHASPVDMATEWMIFPDDQGDDLEAVALSPSKLTENYDKSFTRDIGAEEKYSPFEFHHTDIPETYVQKAMQPWQSLFKVDQLPNNVSGGDVVQQLEGSGYTMQHQRGDFEVYAGEDGFHAVGNDRHIVIVEGDIASTSQQRDLMFRVLEETNDNRYVIPEVMGRGLEELDVRDSLSVRKNPGYVPMPSTDTTSHQPDVGMSSVDFQKGEKSGAWPFEDRQSAENALTLLENNEVRFGYSDIELNNKTVTASGANYDLNAEMNYGGFLTFSDTTI